MRENENNVTVQTSNYEKMMHALEMDPNDEVPEEVLDMLKEYAAKKRARANEQESIETFNIKCMHSMSVSEKRQLMMLEDKTKCD